MIDHVTKTNRGSLGDKKITGKLTQGNVVKIIDVLLLDIAEYDLEGKISRTLAVMKAVTEKVKI